MADDRRTGKDEGEEEEDQEGKAADSTINDSGSASRKTSRTVSDSHRDFTESNSQNVSPIATQSGSERTSVDSPSLRKSPSKITANESAGQSPSTLEEVINRSSAGSSLRKSPSKSLAVSDNSRNSRQSTSPQADASLMSEEAVTGSGARSSLRKSPSKSLAISDDSRSSSNSASPRVGASSRSVPFKDESPKGSIEADTELTLRSDADFSTNVPQPQTTVNINKNAKNRKVIPRKNIDGQSRDRAPASRSPFGQRSPFVHNPPYPEERRARVLQPQCLKDYIINLREDLADFQECHGLPRTRDYSFLSLGLSLAQETGRAIYSVFLMITELFPVIAIASLIIRFALDKVIEILETDGTVPRLKKMVVFALQITLIMIPLWILVATIIIPMFYLILSILRKMFHLSGRKSGKAKTGGKQKVHATPKTKKEQMCACST